MPEPDEDRTPEAQQERFRRDVARRVERKRRRAAEGDRPVWFSLGLMGIVGWSVAVPTLAGVAIGWWLDRAFPGRISWTLTLLFIGAAVGCLNAWYWVKQESERR